MDCGVWDAVYLDSLFTLSEILGGVSSDQVRTWSRVRHFYDFVPASLDEVPVKHLEKENTDYLMLSSLAVSANLIVCDMPRTWSRIALRRVRNWADWARRHADLMRESVFLPDWPGLGACDGYVRLHEGRGYAFFFNANDGPAPARLPLDDSVGLSGDCACRLEVEHATAPPSEPVPERARGAAGFSLPAHAAVLLKIESQA
jgi:hypothetical protein